MRPDDHAVEAQMLLRLARTRPLLSEDDLSPSGERARAILARIIDADSTARPRPWWRRPVLRRG